MSIIGIDIGNIYKKIFILDKSNIEKIESIANNRKIYSTVIKTLNKRWFGEEALSKLNNNYLYTNYNIFDNFKKTTNNLDQINKITMFFNYINTIINNYFNFN